MYSFLGKERYSFLSVSEILIILSYINVSFFDRIFFLINGVSLATSYDSIFSRTFRGKSLLFENSLPIGCNTLSALNIEAISLSDPLKTLPFLKSVRKYNLFF